MINTDISSLHDYDCKKSKTGDLTPATSAIPCTLLLSVFKIINSKWHVLAIHHNKQKNLFF
jgi:hypothetical protein